MKKFFIVAGAIAALVVPSTALAAAPDGTFQFKNNANSNGNQVGKLSSQITHNGQFVSGQDNAYNADQTTTPGSRAALVQSLLGH